MKQFFRCPTHGPLDTSELVVEGESPVACRSGRGVSCRICRVEQKTFQPVEEIPEAWEPEPLSEKARAFIWAASVTMFGLAILFLYRNFERAGALPPFALEALKHWQFPW